MRIAQLLFLVLALSFAVSCKNDSKPVATDENGLYFGEKITEDGVISYNELIAKIEKSEEVQAVVAGKVESVCQAKGCWMNLVSPDGSSKEEMFVKFKDYGFFMPLDIAGKEVIIRGKAYKEETTVDELRHYAEDEGKSEEEIAAIVEPIVELKFMADGVILKP